jgi:hypothetical protein
MRARRVAERTVEIAVGKTLSQDIRAGKATAGEAG